MAIVIRVLIVALVGFLLWWLARVLLQRGQAQGLRERLLVLCRDDVGRVDRLVRLEKDRAPEIGEGEAYRRAIGRLERDLGR